MRCYRALLRVFPASFRDEYGDEMSAAFAERLRGSGVAGRLAAYLGAIADVFSGALAVHLEILGQDLRYTARTLRRNAAFTVTSILVIAIGIGANTAAFAVTDVVLFRELPYRDPHRLMKLWQRSAAYPRFELSPENYRDWKRMSRSFASMGACWLTAANLVVPGTEPQRLTGAGATWDLFSTLGVEPLLGRTFTEAEDRENAAGTIVLSHALWQTLFAGDPLALGRTILLDDRSFVVIGVMPPEFSFPTRSTQFWTPMQFRVEDTDRTNTYLQVAARLAPGATMPSAQADLDAVAAQLSRQFPKENGHTGAAVLRIGDEVSRQSRALLLALSGAAACVLLIVCANLANLFIARALARRREMAVRAAIGAGRDRLLRQLATESIVLAVSGGALGIVVGYSSLPLLARLAPVNLPTAAVPSLDLRVLGFAALLTGATAVLFGWVPAWRAGGDADAIALRQGSRGGARRERLRTVLVAAEVLTSIVLLTGALLLMRALWSVQRTDPGFRSEDVLTMRTTLPWPKYAPVAKRAQFYDQVLTRVRALPGVRDAAYVSGLPMVVRGGIWNVEITGAPDIEATRRAVTLRYATPGFFRTLGIPIKSGRDVDARDTGEAPFVAVVSESFARRFWPDDSPIGKRFSVAFFERTIVGVAADIRTRGLEAPSEPQVYLPFQQIRDFAMPPFAPKDLAVRVSGNTAQVAPAVRAIIREADPTEPVSDVRMLTDVIAQETAPRLTQVGVVGAFAAIAFVLAVIGIQGLLALLVSQRTHEFGVRLALGAHPGDLARMVLRQAAVLTAVSGVPGLLCAYGLARALQALLAGVPPADPVTLAIVAGLTIAMTIVGSLAPVLRALQLSPVQALRVDV
jgi:predicted permease